MSENEQKNASDQLHHKSMNKHILFAVNLIVLGFFLALVTACRVEIADAPALPTVPAGTSAVLTRTPFPSPTTPSTSTPPSEPATTPTEPGPAETAFDEYTVQPGDTLSGIAAEYDLPMAVIQLLNGIGDPTVVQVGQTLSIPPRDGWEGIAALSSVNWEGASRYWVVHVVKAGETLVGIAQAYGLQAAEIKAVNGLTDADLIRVDQELVIPLDAPAVPLAPAPPDTPVPAPTATPTISPTVEAPDVSLAPTAVPATPPPADVADWPRETVRLINQVRAQSGLSPLAYNETLALAAQAHANDCVQRGWCSHTGSDGSDIKTRILRVGYAPASWAECWAQRQTPQGAVDIWMDEVPPNDPHRRTLLATWLSEIGVGVAQTTWGYYFIADFGRP